MGDGYGVLILFCGLLIETKKVNRVPSATPGPAILQILSTVGLKTKFVNSTSTVDALDGTIAALPINEAEAQGPAPNSKSGFPPVAAVNWTVPLGTQGVAKAAVPTVEVGKAVNPVDERILAVLT